MSLFNLLSTQRSMHISIYSHLSIVSICDSLLIVCTISVSVYFYTHVSFCTLDVCVYLPSVVEHRISNNTKMSFQYFNSIYLFLSMEYRNAGVDASVAMLQGDHGNFLNIRPFCSLLIHADKMSCPFRFLLFKFNLFSSSKAPSSHSLPIFHLL